MSFPIVSVCRKCGITNCTTLPNQPCDRPGCDGELVPPTPDNLPPCPGCRPGDPTNDGRTHSMGTREHP